MQALPPLHTARACLLSKFYKCYELALAGWRGGRASMSATSGSGQAVRYLILLCREVAGWRLVRVNTSLLPKFPLWYEIVLAGWRSGSVSHSGRLWNGICSVSVSVQLGFGNESQRSKLNCDSYSVQWLCEEKIYFVYIFLENFSEAVRRF